MLGLIDFKEARPFDRLWYANLNWTLDYLEGELYKQYLQLLHGLHCGALSYLAGKSAFDTHWEQADTVRSQYLRLIFPWADNKDRGTTISQMAKQWQEIFGAADDEETQKKIQFTVKSMYEHANRGRSGQ